MNLPFPRPHFQPQRTLSHSRDPDLSLDSGEHQGHELRKNHPDTDFGACLELVNTGVSAPSDPGRWRPIRGDSRMRTSRNYKGFAGACESLAR